MVASVIVLSLGGWILWNAFQTTPTPSVTASGTVGTNLGDTAPDFSVPTLTGDTFTLSEQRGNPTIVFFMAYWCGTCIPEAQALAQLKQEYGENINIVAVDVDPSSSPQTLNQFRQASGNGTYIWAFDTGQQVATSFKVRSLDTTLILNAVGMVIYRDEFPSSYSTLKKALSEAGF